MIAVKFVVVVVIGYLLGSIPFGVLISHKVGKDIREYGSRKIGATNVLRTVGKKAAVLVASLDLVKGALAVLFAGLLFRQDFLVVEGSGVWWLARGAQVLGALAAITGHIFPVFLGFRGGRGVATFFGGLAALCPVAAIFGGEVLFVGAGLTRFASVGSIAGVVGTYSILVPLTILNGFPVEYLVYALIGSIIVIFMHRDNIARLVSGRERRLGDKAEGLDSSSSTEGTG